MTATTTRFAFHEPGKEVLVRVPMIEHLWPSRSSGLLLGPDKSAKSTYALEEALCLVHRWPVLGRFAVPKSQRVLFISEEDDALRIERRVLDLLRLHDPSLTSDKAALAAYRALVASGSFRLLVKQRVKLHDEEHVAELVRLVTEHAFDVIYMDALGAMTDQLLSNEHVAGPLVAALRKIEATGAVLRIVHHTSKAKTKGYTPDTATVRDGSGHHAVADWARSSLLFSRRKMVVVEPGPEPERVVEVPSLLRFEGSDGAPARLGLATPRYAGNDPSTARLVGLTLTEPLEGHGRLAAADLSKVVEIVNDGATTRTKDERSGVVGVTAATVAARAGFEKRKTVRYLAAAVDAGQLVEASAGKVTVRGVVLWATAAASAPSRSSAPSGVISDGAVAGDRS